MLSIPTQLFINGKFVKGEGELIAVINPSTGEMITQVAEASLAQIQAAVAAAAAAFSSWKKTTPRDRATMLLKLADSIDSNAELLAELESTNCGKPYLAALMMKCQRLPMFFAFLQEQYAI